MRRFLTNCNVARPGADQLHADEEADECIREHGAVKNKSMTARSGTDCLQPSLHIGYTSPSYIYQVHTHTHTHENLFYNKGLKTCLSTNNCLPASACPRGSAQPFLLSQRLTGALPRHSAQEKALKLNYRADIRDHNISAAKESVFLNSYSYC